LVAGVVAVAMIAGNAFAATSAIATSHTFIDLETSLSFTLDSANNTSVSGEYQVASWDSTLVRPAGTSVPGKPLPPMNDVLPFLATKWKLTPKGVVFTLRSGVKSSWGNPLTVADVVWSFQRACVADGNASFFFGLINAPVVYDKNFNATCPQIITPMGGLTFRVNQTAPSPYTLGSFTALNFQIFDAKEAKLHATAGDPWALKWLNHVTASFGPYEVKDGDFTPSQKIILTANPYYWDAKDVYYKTVVLDYVPNTYNEQELLARGEASHSENVSYDQFNALKKLPNIRAFLLPSGNSERVSFFLKNAAWDNVNVRKAISEGINRAQIVKTIFAGDATVDCYPIPNTYSLPFKDPCDEPYNPTDAKKLLAAAGYTASNPLEFTMSSTVGDSGPYITPEMELVQSQMAAIGVKMDINIVPNTDTYNTNDYIPIVAYSTTLDAGGTSFTDGGLDEELLYNTDIFPGTYIDGVQGYTNPTMLAEVRQMLKTTSKATYNADVKAFAYQLAASYMQANVVEIPEQVVSAAGITGYESYYSPIMYYDLLHPGS